MTSARIIGILIAAVPVGAVALGHGKLGSLLAVLHHLWKFVR